MDGLNIDSPRECTLILYIDEEEGGTGKLTAREIAEEVLPAEDSLDENDTTRISRNMRYAKNRGWVKSEKVTECKYKYYLTDTGRRYMRYLLEDVFGLLPY